MSDHAMVRILFLAANPQDTSRLRIEEEMRAVDLALQGTQYREWFDLRCFVALRFNDLQELFLRYQPHIVHFSGHGSNSGEIILEDDFGKGTPISPHALEQIFAVLPDNIRCVVLNTCYSALQAQTIAQHIDCVVGMPELIKDGASINFAAAFYQALGFGRDVKTAFDLGCIQIENRDENGKPILLTTKINPSRVFFVRSLETRYVPLIDHREALELFHQLLDPYATKRIMRVMGDSKMGKSHLLTKVFPIVAHQHDSHYVILDLRNQEQNIITHLYNACTLLGYTRFKAFNHAYSDLSSTRTQLTGLQSLLPIMMKSKNKSTEVSIERLTRCFVDDLRQFAPHPLVLIFDTVDNATNATQKWLTDSLLVQLQQLPHIRVIMGGRTLPKASGTYAAACYNYTLQPIEEIDAYIQYCQEVNANLPKEAIPAIAKVLAYTPGSFAETIETHFLNRRPING